MLEPGEETLRPLLILYARRARKRVTVFRVRAVAQLVE